MNSKDDILRRPFEHRDYSFESKYNLDSSAKKSYYDQHERSSYAKNPYDDVEALAQYELKREREKTRILEERLKNKQIFIGQMKEFQRELTRAFDQSQQQLGYYKAKCDQLSGVELTGCLDEIAQLKLMLGESQEHTRKLEDDLAAKPRSYSKERPPSKSLQRANTDQVFHTRGNQQARDKDRDKQASPTEFAKQFAGTFTNYSVNEVLSSGDKLGKFISRFLLMVETCNPQTSKQSLKDHLKFGWRWVKDVVKNSGKAVTSLNHNDHEQLLEAIRKLTSRKSIGEILPFVEDVLQQWKQQQKTLKVITNFYQLPEDTPLKQLQKFLREKRQGHRS